MRAQHMQWTPETEPLNMTWRIMFTALLVSVFLLTVVVVFSFLAEF